MAGDGRQRLGTGVVLGRYSPDRKGGLVDGI
jgi:hypothetical protein